VSSACIDEIWFIILAISFELSTCLASLTSGLSFGSGYLFSAIVNNLNGNFSEELIIEDRFFKIFKVLYKSDVSFSVLHVKIKK